MPRDIVCGWAWNPAQGSCRSPHHLPEITNTAVLMFPAKVPSIFIDCKGNRVVAWSWNPQGFLVFVDHSSRQRIGDFTSYILCLIISWGWIFVLDCID